MGIKSAGLFDVATDHLERIHRELKTQTSYLHSLVSTDIEEESETFRWLRSQSVADGTGLATLFMDNRAGFALELVSWSTVAGVATAGIVNFYLNSAEPQNLVWTSAQTQFKADKFTSGMIVPVNGMVVVQFLTAGAAQQVFANVLARNAQIGKTKPYKVQLPGW